MLKELRIKNFAVIDELRLEFEPGLNVLTGETGAGKSIIVGALSLLLGERASSDVVRAGEDRAVIEATFDAVHAPELAGELASLCREAGIEPEASGWLILRREVQREGRNRAWVNSSAATARLIGELGSRLADLHGQHEHQRLLRREAQLQILDAYSGSEALVADVAREHAALAAVRHEREELMERLEETRQQAEFLRFKAEEIEAARLEPGEEERGAAELRRLEHSEDLLRLSSTLHESIYAAEGAVVERLGELRRTFAELARIDPDAAELDEMRESALEVLQELGRRLGEYHESVEHDPWRLAALRERLDLLYRLRRKYGTTVEEVIEAGRGAREELDRLESSDRDLRGLQKREEGYRRKLGELAAELSEERREGAARLAAEVSALLPEIGMPGGRIEVALEPLEEPHASGAERIEFRVTTNPGFEPGPLSRVASGGELSRVMLALKSVLAGVDEVPTLVFDEIDAGVGGRVAHCVAERLAAVAGGHQVFAITHLPQIAARADHHLRVEKGETEGRAAAFVAHLDRPGRVDELARMLGGDSSSRISRRHAEELLSVRTDRAAPAG